MDTGHYVLAAKILKRRLNGRAFDTIPRTVVTQLLRHVSAEASARLKRSSAVRFERTLLEQGIRVYPLLSETTAGDRIRILHTGSVLAAVIDALDNPSTATDDLVAEVITKQKGRWDWSR